MSDVQTVPVADLEEMLDHEVPCGDCGNPAQLRSDGHGCKPNARCLKCWQSWLTRVLRDIANQGRVVCRYCDRRFPTVESFADYRPF